MFLRDMIINGDDEYDSASVSASRYGDWLLQTNQSISPHDYLLWRHEFNYSLLVEVPHYADAFSMYSARTGDLNIAVRSLYDFMLLNLVRAWRRPWTVDSHHSFQPGFRRACTTLALCTHRTIRNVLKNHSICSAMIVQMILPFLHRDWWPDERRQCFSQSCLLSSISNKLQQKIIARNSIRKNTKDDADAVVQNRQCRACKAGCVVEQYCSKDCAKDAWKEGHKRMCRYPPYRFGRGEEALCCEIVNGSIMDDCIDSGTAAAAFSWADTCKCNAGMAIYSSNTCSTALTLAACSDAVAGDIAAADDDDDGSNSSWESVSSDEEEEVVQKSKADVVCEYFEKRSYRHQRTEPLPFAGFYVDDE